MNKNIKQSCEQSKLLHGNLPEREDDYIIDKYRYLRWAFYMACIICMIWILTSCSYGAELPQNKAVNAIIGEAEGNYMEMVAVGCALRNRGGFSGVYGLHSYRVEHHKYSRHTYNMAVRAWHESALKDITGGATGWGNAKDVEIFKHSSWFPSVCFTAHIGRQWFYTTE